MNLLESRDGYAREAAPRPVACRLPCYAAATRPSASSDAVKSAALRTQPVLRVLRPRATVRWRLTLLYSVLFLICGAALLAILYEFFIAFAFAPPPKPRFSPSEQSAILAQIAGALAHQRSVYLNHLLVGSVIALAIVALVSGVLGWVMAGRVLAPLRTITATTERISATDLHERLAMPGPRDELRQLADTIDRLLERLEAAFDAQRRFVANASHELRTPLTTMRAVLDVASAKPNAPPLLKTLDTNLRQIARPSRPAARELPRASARPACRARHRAGIARAAHGRRPRPAQRGDRRQTYSREHEPPPGSRHRKRNAVGTDGRQRDRERRAP